MNVKKLLIKIGTAILKIAGIALAVYVLYRVALFAYDYGYRIFAEEPIDREPGIDVNVAIVEGKSVKDIGKLLEDKGLIRDARLFVFQEKLSEYAGDLRPGNYTLNTSQTPYEMMAIMSATDEELAEMEEQRAREAAERAAEEASGEETEEGGEEDLTQMNTDELSGGDTEGADTNTDTGTDPGITLAN